VGGWDVEEESRGGAGFRGGKEYSDVLDGFGDRMLWRWLRCLL